MKSHFNILYVLGAVIFLFYCEQPIASIEEPNPYDPLADTYAPPVPEDLRLTFVGDYIRLNWMAQSVGKDGFIIEKSFDNDIWFELGRVSKDLRVYVDETVEFEETVSYRVSAYLKKGDNDVISDQIVETLSFKQPSYVLTPILSPDGKFTEGIEIKVENEDRTLLSGHLFRIVAENNAEKLYETTFGRSFVGQSFNLESINAAAPFRDEVFSIQPFLVTRSDTLFGEVFLNGSSTDVLLDLLSIDLENENSVLIKFTSNLSIGIHRFDVFKNNTEKIASESYSPQLNGEVIMDVSLDEFADYTVSYFFNYEGQDSLIKSLEFQTTYNGSAPQLENWGYSEIVPSDISFRYQNADLKFPVLFYRSISGGDPMQFHRLPKDSTTATISDAGLNQSDTYTYYARQLYSDNKSNNLTYSYDDGLKLSKANQYEGGILYHYNPQEEVVYISVEEYEYGFQKVNLNTRAVSVLSASVSRFTVNSKYTLAGDVNGVTYLFDSQSLELVNSFIIDYSSVGDNIEYVVRPTLDPDTVLVSIGSAEKMMEEYSGGPRYGTYKYVVSADSLILLEQHAMISTRVMEGDENYVVNTRTDVVTQFDGHGAKKSNFNLGNQSFYHSGMGFRYQKEFEKVIFSLGGNIQVFRAGFGELERVFSKNGVNGVYNGGVFIDDIHFVYSTTLSTLPFHDEYIMNIETGQKVRQGLSGSSNVQAINYTTGLVYTSDFFKMSVYTLEKKWRAAED